MNATWTRADQTYVAEGHWFGRPVEAMAEDVWAGYVAAQKAEPLVRDVVPTGTAWNRAFHEGIADTNPYDGIDAGKVDLWAIDHYHASVAGYYLEALVIFAAVTGRDPTSLGSEEGAAADLGIPKELAIRLQQIAAAEIKAH